jgi:cobalamin biosynthesis Mg chelatase CobN
MSISTTNGLYTDAASQAREATEKSVTTFKQGIEKFVDQTNVVAKLPTIDLTQPVARYFEYVQKSVDFNRDLLTKWAELVTSMTGTIREQAEKVSAVVKDQTEVVSDLAVKQAEKAEDIANEQANKVEEAKQEQEKAAKAAERAAAKQAKEQAREPYEGLTKAELADILSERELPKSGTVEELIERLVAADSE